MNIFEKLKRQSGYGKWIPISEQEPPCGHIIVTVLWEKGVDTAYDDDYEVFEEDWWALNDSPMAQRIKARTIAWMPMPEPYKRR